jgi:Xaa-Pro aminopeptidase
MRGKVTGASRAGMDYKGRLVLLKRLIAGLGVDALLVTNETDVSYISGFAGHDSMLVLTPSRQYFITDSRYVQEAEESLEDYRIKLVTESTYATIGSIMRDCGARRLGFEPMKLPYGVVMRLKKSIGGTRLLSVADPIAGMRQVKDDAEVEAIKRSAKLTGSILKKALALVEPGASELEIAGFVTLELFRSGAAAAFEPIVACGENSSKPHSTPGRRTIRPDSFVMIDIGARLAGYCSDMTRTVITGRMSDKFAEIYSIVREAQRRAIEKVRDGARISSVDFAARGYIHSKGYGKHFGHSVGHGVGMEIHEGPTVSRNNEAFFKSGMVVTIEPAIYLSGFGGVRIEDMVLVKRRGCEILT